MKHVYTNFISNYNISDEKEDCTILIYKNEKLFAKKHSCGYDEGHIMYDKFVGACHKLDIYDVDY